MRQGTTPPIAVEVGADWTGFDVHLTFSDGYTAITKKSEDGDIEIEVADGVTKLTTALTQAETLSLHAGSLCEVQARAFNADGSQADATSIACEPIERIIEQGELPEGEPDELPEV